MKQELVKNWMTTDVITITPDTSLHDTHRLMTDNNIRRLPVLKEKRLVGIVTLGDVRGAEPSGATSLSIWEVNYLLAKLNIDEIMHKEVISTLKVATIEDAAKIMFENKISGLPVVDNQDNLIGIITESDIFRLVVNAWHDED